MTYLLAAFAIPILSGMQALDEFHVIIENRNVAPVEVYVTYRTRTNTQPVRVAPGTQRKISVEWQDRPFYIAIRIREDGLFEPRGGGWPRSTSYYTDLMKAAANEEITIDIPSNIALDARFRRERPYQRDEAA